MKSLKNNLSKLDKPLLICTVVFFVFGLIMIQSASATESYMRYGNSPYMYFFKQLIHLGAGIFVFFFAISFPTKKYRGLALVLMYICIALLVYVKVNGYVSNSAQSWINLGFATLQPSEFFKIASIVYLAVYFDKNKTKLDSQWYRIKPILLLFIGFMLVVVQPDLGTASIILFMCVMIIFSIPSKQMKFMMYKMLLVAVIIVGGVLVATNGSLLRSYQLSRFEFLNPCDRYKEDTGYQVCNSFIAFNNGGLTGKGIGESTQKYLYLPEAYTDFIFPIIVEEWGAIVGALLIMMYAFILIRIYLIAKRATNLRGSMIAYGVFCYILLHICVNLVGVMGLAPLTGVPLPFLSYGGSFALSLMLALGLVQRVAIENKKLLKN